MLIENLNSLIRDAQTIKDSIEHCETSIVVVNLDTLESIYNIEYIGNLFDSYEIQHDRLLIFQY